MDFVRFSNHSFCDGDCLARWVLEHPAEAAQQKLHPTRLWVCASCGNYMGEKHVEGCSLAESGG